MEGQWWWAPVMLIGGLLAGGYILMVLGKTLSDPDVPLKAHGPTTRSREIVALTLALCAVLLSLVPLRSAEFLQIGRSVTSAVAPQ
jgi:hypothetical protein